MLVVILIDLVAQPLLGLDELLRGEVLLVVHGFESLTLHNADDALFFIYTDKKREREKTKYTAYVEREKMSI